MTNRAVTRDEIGLLIYPGVQLAAVHGLTDLIVIANRMIADDRPDMAPIRVSHWTHDEGDGMSSCGSSDRTDGSGSLFALVVPPSLTTLPSAELTAPYHDWLHGAYRSGVILGSVCAGTFLLAETGLLAGRVATTHWMHAEAFRRRFPAVRLEVEHLLADEGDIVTAGGVMAWTDMGLRLVERLRGAAVMIATARALLIDPPGRQQRFYSRFMPPLGHGDAAVAKVQALLGECHGRNVSVAALADHAGLEERTFQRRFRAATGLTTTQYAQRLRIAHAQDLLQLSDRSIEQVAWDSGYADPVSFRKVFLRITGLSPSAYRRRLSAGADASAAGGRA